MVGQQFAATKTLPKLRAKVIVIEEQQAVADLLKIELTGCGFDVSLLPLSSAAPGLIERAGADLIILDVQMHQRNGWEFLQELRSHVATREVPVVIASTGWQRAGLRKLPPGGPVRFAGKPFDIAHLCRIVASLVMPSPAQTGSEVTPNQQNRR